MCSWSRLVREGLSLSHEGMPILRFVRKLLCDVDFKKVSSVSQLMLTPRTRCLSVIPGNAARGKFSPLVLTVGLRKRHSRHQWWSVEVLPSPSALKPQCRKVSFYYILI